MSDMFPSTALLAGGSLVGGIIAGILGALVEKRRLILRRAERIRFSTDLLNQHYDAADRFLGDIASPVALQEIVLWMSDMSANHDAACAMMEKIRASDSRDRNMSEGAQNVLREIDTLSRHRPDLVEAFETAVSTAMFAAFLRWDTTASAFEQLVTKGASSPRKEIVLAADSARSAKNNRPMSNSELDLVPAY